MVEQSLAQKIYKVEVNIMTCHIIYGVLRDLNFEDLSIGGLYMEQSLKIIILQLPSLKDASFAEHVGLQG